MPTNPHNSKDSSSYVQLEDHTRDHSLARKSLFLGLLVFTTVLILVLLGIFWTIPYIGLGQIHSVAPWVLAALFGAIALAVIWSSLALVLSILLRRAVLFSAKMRGLAITLYLPLMVAVGKLFGLSRESIQASFIQVNNDMVRAERGKSRPGEILLLMPHCLQNSRCKYRLTYDIYNCRRCGECQIADLLGFSEAYGVKLAIATGGTIARRIVVQNRPKLIIAVACERDLSSGIQDTYPLPVFGILNRRPHGPCLDTWVPLERLESAIQDFLSREANVEPIKAGESKSHKQVSS